MKTYVVGPLIAAIAMFVWGFLYWGLPHYLPYGPLKELPNEAAVATALGQLFPATGAYLIPHPKKGQENMDAQMKHGPTVEVYITKEGMNGMDPGMMTVGFLHGLVVSVVLAMILSAFGGALPTYCARVKLCASIGAICFLAHMADAVWWHHPWGWTFAKAIYDFSVLLIAGFIVAKFAAKPAA